jgi:hypothetical protein
MVIVTPSSFVSSVADKLAQVANDARIATPFADGRLRPPSALEAVARCVQDTVRAAQPRTHPRCDAREHEQRPIADPRWMALWVATDQAARYEPNERSEQTRFLAKLATDFAGYADPGKTIQTLTVLAITDRVQALRRAEGAAAAEREQLASRTAELDELRAMVAELREGVAEVERQRVELVNELATRNTELNHERHVVGFLRQLTGSDEQAPPPRPARRTLIDGETGIYRTSAGDLEIGWKLDGRQRWEIVGKCSLEEARITRADRLAGMEVPK